MAGVEMKLEERELDAYLETLNDEIVANKSNEDDDDDDEDGSYFIDEAGNYYYRATKDSEPVLTEPPEGMEHEFEPIDEEEENAEDEVETIAPDPAISTRRSNRIRKPTAIVKESASDEGTYYLEEEDAPNNEVMEVEEHLEEDNEDDEVYQFEITDTETKQKIGGKSLPNLLTEADHLCSYCPYKSSKRYLLSRHMKSHSEERPYKCTVCDRGFKTFASLTNHSNTHTGTRPHSCKVCDRTFTTSGELVRHIRYKHTHEKPHKCTECDYASVELSKLKRHFRCHTGERPYQCPHCTYASPDTFKLKRHLRIHTGEKPYECDICHARFTQSNSLKAHKLIHSVGDKPVFSCELCPTTCGRKTDLRIHMQKLHSSDTPHKCQRCGKEYPDRYSYKLHVKTHEGEKCYSCDICTYASISARHLESHMLIHSDLKPYQCDQCDLSFRQKQLLKRHVNLYHNPDYVPPTPREKKHKCPACDKSFRHKGNLIRHMAQHDPDPEIAKQAQELKDGRLKRVQTIGDTQVEIYQDEYEYEDEDDEAELEHVYVEGGDEENEEEYMVLEVIPVDKKDGVKGILENDTIIRVRKSEEANDQIADDMANCFGFDDGEEDDDEDRKGNIKLIDYDDN